MPGWPSRARAVRIGRTLHPDLVPGAGADVSLDGRSHQGEGVVVAAEGDVQQCEVFVGLVGGELDVQRCGHVDGSLEEAEGFARIAVSECATECHAGVGDAVRIADLVGELGDFADAGQVGAVTSAGRSVLVIDQEREEAS